MKTYLIIKKYIEYTNRYSFVLGMDSNRNHSRIHAELESALDEAKAHILLQTDEDSLFTRKVFVAAVSAEALKPLLAKKPETLTLAPSEWVQFSEFHGYVDKLELPTPNLILLTPLPVIWPTVYLIINYQETTPVIGQFQLFPTLDAVKKAVMLQDVFSYEGCSIVATDLSDLLISLAHQNESSQIIINRLEEYIWLHGLWNRILMPAPDITLQITQRDLARLLAS